jgi:hypothetical protein
MRFKSFAILFLVPLTLLFLLVSCAPNNPSKSHENGPPSSPPPVEDPLNESDKDLEEDSNTDPDTKRAEEKTLEDDSLMDYLYPDEYEGEEDKYHPDDSSEENDGIFRGKQ